MSKSQPAKQSTAKTPKTPKGEAKAVEAVMPDGNAADAAPAEVHAEAPEVKPAPAERKASKSKGGSKAGKAEVHAQAEPAHHEEAAKVNDSHKPKDVAHHEEKPKKANGESFVVDNQQTRREVEADAKLSPFLRKQKERLLQLRDNILDSMNGVAKDTLRSRAEGSEASAFGMHQADAGSDAYDRDFALSLLSQEQDALYEIEEALKRIEQGSYGACEMSGKQIAHARLEAIPFARYTVECQAQIEKQTKAQRSRTPVTSLFGLTDAEDGGESEEEETVPEPKD